MRTQKKQKEGYSRVMNSVGIEGAPQLKSDEQIIDFETEYGTMRITVEGNIKDNHVFLTYHDIGMNHDTCFRRFFNDARRCDDVYKKFGVVHIDAPGQQTEADQISDDVAYLDMDVLATLIDKVLERLEIKKFFAFGVGAGAYILGLYATRNPSRVKAMVLVGATSKKCGWIEWRHKWFGILGENIMKGTWKHFFYHRWFSRTTIDSNLDLIDFYSIELNRIPPGNLLKFVHGYQRRRDYSEDLKKISCQVMFFTGEVGYLEKDMIEMAQHIEPHNCNTGCYNTGSTVIIEDPHALVEPIRLLLRGMAIW